MPIFSIARSKFLKDMRYLKQYSKKKTIEILSRKVQVEPRLNPFKDTINYLDNLPPHARFVG